MEFRGITFAYQFRELAIENAFRKEYRVIILNYLVII